MTVTRKFRGSEYTIHVVNQAGDEKGKLVLTLDGKPLNGNVIPADEKPGKHVVEAILS